MDSKDVFWLCLAAALILVFILMMDALVAPYEVLLMERMENGPLPYLPER